MELAPYIALTILSILALGPMMRFSYELPRRLGIVVGGIAVLVYTLIYGASVNLPIYSLYFLGGFVLCMFTSAIHADNPTLVWSEFAVWSSILLSFTLIPIKLSAIGLSILMVGFGINCIVVILQRIFHIEPFKQSQNATWLQPIGLIGNSNFLANFMCIGFFMSMYLGVNESRWWLILTVLIGGVIGVTKCRGGYLGVLGGSAYLLTAIINGAIQDALIVGMICFVACTFILYRKQLTDFGAFRERVNYLRIGIEQLRHSPILGVGLGCLRCFVPFLQRRLNVKTRGEFLQTKNYLQPWPHNCHNNLLQIAIDLGVFGAVAWVGLMVIALMSPIDVVLKAGVVASLVAGVCLHSLYASPTNVFNWFLVFLCLRAYPETTHVVVPWYMIVAMLVFMLALCKYVLYDLIAAVYFMQFAKTKSLDKLNKASKFAPTDGNILTHLAGQSHMHGKSWEGLIYSLAAIMNYDGDNKLWELWTNAGKACLVLGAPVLADYCNKTALTFLPNYDEGVKFSAQINDILSKGFKVIRPNGSNTT